MKEEAVPGWSYHPTARRRYQFLEAQVGCLSKMILMIPSFLAPLLWMMLTWLIEIAGNVGNMWILYLLWFPVTFISMCFLFFLECSHIPILVIFAYLHACLRLWGSNIQGLYYFCFISEDFIMNKTPQKNTYHWFYFSCFRSYLTYCFLIAHHAEIDHEKE